MRIKTDNHNYLKRLLYSSKNNVHGYYLNFYGVVNVLITSYFNSVDCCLFIL